MSTVVTIMKVVDGAKKRKQSNVKSQDILRLLSNRISKRSNDLIHRVLCCNVFSLSVRPKSKSASSQKKNQTRQPAIFQQLLA